MESFRPQEAATQRSEVFTLLSYFFFNDTATTEIYTLSLHDALPISVARPGDTGGGAGEPGAGGGAAPRRSEEHTSELQSQSNILCRLLLAKKNKQDRDNSDLDVTHKSALCLTYDLAKNRF